MPARRRTGPEPRINWERLPYAGELPAARAWLEQAAAAGLAGGTVGAYSRAVERFLAYCRQRRISPARATTDQITAYLRELAAAGLGPATRVQRLTAVRLFYAFVVQEGGRADNPADARVPLLASLAPSGEAGGVGGAATGARGTAAPAPAAAAVPWIPGEDEWQGVLTAAAAARPRDRLMLALAYDGGLRREELCALRVGDLDPQRRLVRVPAGAAGGRRPRALPLTPVVTASAAEYLRGRPRGDRPAALEGALFVSESARNRAAPLAVWGWSKVVLAIARRAGVARFTPSTPRHLRLTDLARTGRGADEIARFGGQDRPGEARRYLLLAQRFPAGRALTVRRGDQLHRLLAGRNG